MCSRFCIVSYLLIATLLLVFWMDLSFGDSYLNVFDTLLNNSSSNGENSLILIEFRLPKSIAAIVVGIALGVSGLLMQTLFRNPIAGPYVLGISSGASLGVSIVLLGGSWIATNEIMANFSIITAALLGSLLMVLALILVFRIVKNVMTLLILGMMFGALSTSLSSILQFFSPSYQLKSFILWTFGSLSHLNYFQLALMSLVILIGLIPIIINIKGINILVLGADNLKNFGLSSRSLQYSILISTAILTGAATAFCGPIGFVGIVVPHFSRWLIQSSDHKKLLPMVALIGAIFMLLSDMLTFIPGNGTVLPINAVTALLGIPVVFWILLKPSKKINL